MAVLAWATTHVCWLALHSCFDLAMDARGHYALVLEVVHSCMVVAVVSMATVHSCLQQHSRMVLALRAVGLSRSAWIWTRVCGCVARVLTRGRDVPDYCALVPVVVTLLLDLDRSAAVTDPHGTADGMPTMSGQNSCGDTT